MILDFNSYISKKTEHFTGRNWVFKEINDWLRQSDASRYFLLTGEPGSGKSAVAAILAKISAGKVSAPFECQNIKPGFLQAIHFCSTTDGTWIDPRIFARSIALQLSSIDEYKDALMNVGDRDINIDVRIRAGTVQSGANIKGVVIENLIIQNLSGQEAFNRTVLDPLHSIYENGYNQPIIILVDSLDETLSFSAGEKIVYLLASIGDIDKRVRFILTSRPEPRVENKFNLVKRLSLSDQKYKKENNNDITAFVKQRLRTDKALSTKVAVLPSRLKKDLPTNISDKADGNFQYVAFLLDSVVKDQQSLSSPAGLPLGLYSLYHESLERVVTLGNKDRDMVYKPFLGILSVALEPLTLKLLQTYISSMSSLWNVYMDLFQFVEAVPGSSQTGEKEGIEDSYKLYHQSMIDFLHKQQWIEIINGEKKPNEYFIEPLDSHAQIVSACERPKDSWLEVNWSKAAPYTLRRLATHLYHLSTVDGYSNKLHTLLENRSFVDHHLAIIGKPSLLLDDLRLALKISIENDDLAQTWRHIREYRRVIRDQMDFEKLSTAVETGNRTGDYVHITERTGLYSYMPNSQALTRLWIAWNAATNGHTNATESIIKSALERLSPRGKVRFATSQAGSLTTQSVEDAIGETLQRLLIRIAQTVKKTIKLQAHWLRDIMSSWPEPTIESTVEQLSKPLTSWGKLFDAGDLKITMDNLFQELQERGGRLDADISSDRDTIYFFQRRLAAGLFNSQHDPGWTGYVRRSVELIALDDYPSYREMALSWVAAACLTHEDSSLACNALAIVLGGMFKPSPGFWGDTVAAAMDGMMIENKQGTDKGQLESLLEHVEATGERGVDPAVYRKLREIMQWRRMGGLPEDPWSLSIRRRSAVAAVLYRRGDLPGAEAFLKAASSESYQGSYAGFRALARLSLACRWLELQRFNNAVEQIILAKEDANHVRDNILRQERIDMVNLMHRWIIDYSQNPNSLNEDEALIQLQRKSGLERGLFIEFLSAIWSDNAAHLKRLLPLALDDATTTDAVLGRLLGVESLQSLPGRPFLQLVDALHINTGVENN